MDDPEVSVNLNLNNQCGGSTYRTKTFKFFSELIQKTNKETFAMIGFRDNIGDVTSPYEGSSCSFNISETLKYQNYDYIFYQESNYFTLVKNNAKKLSILMNQSVVKDLMEEFEHYHYFVFDENYLYTIAKDEDVSMVQNDNSLKSLPEVIFAVQENEEMNYILNSHLSSNYNPSQKLEGRNSVFYKYLTKVYSDESSRTTNLTSGVLVNEKDVLNDWYGMLDEILGIIIVLLVISGFLFLLALFAAWMIAVYVKRTVTNPISKITQYLNGEKELSYIDKQYNKEINDILRLLRLLETAEKFVDPNFLLNPDPEVRFQNLEEADFFFKEIYNSRGQSIVKNLKGNIHFMNQDYDKAVKEYEDALAAIESLKEEVEDQETKENELSQEEKAKLRQNTTRLIGDWSKEKEFLDETIADRLQQLAKSMQANLDSYGSFNIESRVKTLNAIKEHQIRALQYYLTRRKELPKALNLMIDLIYTFQQRQYYHPAKIIIEVVTQTLNQVPSGQDWIIDIDISQLSQAGIEIRDVAHSENHHFSVNITFEKEVLRQKLLYRKGMLYKEQRLYKEAANSFVDAIENVAYFDTDITKTCVSELYEMMRKFNKLNDSRLTSLIKHEDYLNKLQKPSITFVLAFRLEVEDSVTRAIAKEIVDFVGSHINNKSVKFGALTSLYNQKLLLDTCERVNPSQDLRRMIDYVSVQDFHSNSNHVYDTMLQAMKLIKEPEGASMVVFYDAGDEISAAKVDDLDIIFENGVSLIHIPISKFTHAEFEEKLRQRKATMLAPSVEYELSSVLAELKKELQLN